MTAQLASQLQDALGSDYRVEQELAGGGMSRLFIATDLRHDRRVVVKVLSPELVSTESTARFKREIELTVRLQHPHILPILTSGSWEDVLYYITPFIPGESLKARIEREKKLPLDDIVKILRDVSGALAFAHQRGIVHRDVKPGNILLAEGHAILADFGIARAMVTNATPLTGSGMTPGTPAYMAPELPTDAGADVFALGIVAAEMLIGRLPRRGMTVRELIADRGKVPGDRVATVRALAEIVTRSTASLPDRTQSAGDFRKELEGATPVHNPRLLVMSAIALAVVAGGVALSVLIKPPSLRPDEFVVVNQDRADTSGIDRDLNEALSLWNGIVTEDQNRVRSQLARGSTNRLQADEARDVARKLTAANLIVVAADRAADSVVVRATLSDVRRDSVVRTRRVAYSSRAPAADRVMAVRRLANSLLRDRDELPWRDASDDSVASLAAWREYDAGRQFIDAWDLRAAVLALRKATDSSARVGPAYLWLSQAIFWLDPRKPSADVRALARRSMEIRQHPGELDSLHAAALIALGDHRLPDACAAFERMATRDSSSIAAWVGKGDCRALDRAVVSDDRSKTRWRFRSSFEAAARAYQRAADLGPATGAFQGWILSRLNLVLYRVTNQIRLGHLVGSDSLGFAAWQSVDHDTLTFVAFPRTELVTGRFRPSTESMQAAVVRNRAIMRHTAEEWVRRSPASAPAYDSLSTWVEAGGGTATLPDGQMTALDLVRKAISLSKDSAQRVQLGVREVRLLVKDRQFDLARSHAESLLKSVVGIQNSYVDGSAGLAALVGLPEETARLLARDSNNARVVGSRGIVEVPRQLAEIIARLITYSSLGLSGDSTHALVKETASLIDSYFPGAAAPRELKRAVLYDAVIDAYPDGREILLEFGEGSNATERAFQALASNQIRAARDTLAAMQAHTGRDVQGTSIEMNLRRARLAVAIGDTAAAIRELDPFLRALPTLGLRLLSEVPQAAALVRAFALRAEIAEASRDRTTARECARAVTALWQHADPRLQPVVSRMRVLAR